MQVGTYSGDTFGSLMRQYSLDRMQRDSAYKKAVYKAIEERKTKPVQKHG